MSNVVFHDFETGEISGVPAFSHLPEHKQAEVVEQYNEKYSHGKWSITS